MKVHIWHTKIARSVVFSIAVLLAVTVVQTVGSSQASAMFNRGEYHGFFTNSYAPPDIHGEDLQWLFHHDNRQRTQNLASQ